MAFESGTATDSNDLLSKFITFVTTNSSLVSASENWTTLSTTSPSIFDNYYYMRAPGLSTADEIYMNFGNYSNVVDDVYNWDIRGALNYESSFDYDAQPGLSPQCVSYFWNQTMPYWFIANGQRAIVVAKVSTYYSVSYFGKINPFAPPSQVPYPLLIGGTSDNLNYRWSESVERLSISCFMSPGEGCQFYTVGGGWQKVRNRFGTNSNSNDSDSTTSIHMSPTSRGEFFKTSSNQWANNSWGRIKQNLDGTYTLLPFWLMTDRDKPSKNSFGSLDGVFWVTGDNNAPENIIQYNGDDYLVVQNMHRTDWQEFAAIKLV